MVFPLFLLMSIFSSNSSIAIGGWEGEFTAQHGGGFFLLSFSRTFIRIMRFLEVAIFIEARMYSNF